MRLNPFSDRSRTKFWAALTGLLVVATRVAQVYPDPRVQAIGTALQPVLDPAAGVTGSMAAIRLRDGVAASGPKKPKK